MSKTIIRRSFLQPAAATSLAALLSSCLWAAATNPASGDSRGQQGAKKPNVILLFADQHHKRVMGFEGHPDVMTPNLDKLAGQSVVFDRAYCTRGVCVPSRISLMTGMMPRTLGVLDNADRPPLLNDVVSMATLFKYNGYRTFAFGKRHLSGAADMGWDIKKGDSYRPDEPDNYVSWIEREGHIKEFTSDWAAEFGRGPKGSSEYNTRIPTADLGTRVSKLPEGYTMEAYTAQETINMIKGKDRNGKPFFCWASFYRPHQPYTPLPKYMALYDASKWGEGTKKGSAIKRPQSFFQPTETLPPMLQSQRRGGNKVWNMDKAFANEQLWRIYIAAYYALVTEMDHHIGEILKALKEAGIENDTIVLYAADHGDFVGNHGMVEKCATGHNVYEDILNVPLIIKIPGKSNNGKRVSELVTLADVLPTLIQVLDLKLPPLKYPIQGQSLAKVVTGTGSLNRDYVVSESWSQACVITKDVKLGIMLDPTAVHPQWDFRTFGDMFFDTLHDPLEVDNRITDVKYKQQIATLRGYYADFVKQTPATGKEQLLHAPGNTDL
jgi:arylsulfatase A-like enzyme